MFADELACRFVGCLCRCVVREQVFLVRVEEDLLLGLAAEDLALEPLELGLERFVLGLEAGDADRSRVGGICGVNCLFRLRNHEANFTMPIA